MNNNIIDLEEYKRALEIKEDLDNGIVTIEELSLEDLELVSDVFIQELRSLSKDIKVLEQTNMELKRIHNITD